MVNSTSHLSEEELLSALEEASRFIEIGASYVHYQNAQSIYKVTGLVILEATQEPAVQYHKASASSGLKSITWIRTTRSWLEEICVQNKMVKRFQKVV